MGDTKTLTAQCYCKAVHYTITISTAALPLEVHLCHCTICRYTHGTLCTFHAPLPDGIEPSWIAPSGLHALSGYKHSAAAGERFFCSTCGCHIGDVDVNDDKKWMIATSIFDNHSPDIFRIATHVYTNSTPGTGLYDWLPRIGERELRVWNPEDEAHVSSVPRPGAPPPDNNGERLRAQCHCGGVSFTFPRPTQAVREDDFMKRFVSPVDPTKWVGLLDTCDDCRLVSGSHVIGWTFVPLQLLEPQPDRSQLQLGTSRTFVSSKGVIRTFCGTCGATVFFSSEERIRNDGERVVDIAVGLLRAPEGIAAEDWLTWRTGLIGFAPSGERFDADFTKSLKQGFETWGRNKYGTTLSFDIA